MNRRNIHNLALLPDQIVRLARSGWCVIVAALTILLPSGVVAQQFATSVTSVAPNQMANGQQRALLQFTLSNPLGGGIPVVQWTTLGLRFEAVAGVPITAASAPTLISNLEIYRDANASGAFEPASDLLVAQYHFLALGADGAVNLSFEGSDPAMLQVESGMQRRFFIVLTLTEDASGASPNTFRLTHLANGPLASTASVANTGTVITGAASPDVSTPIITASLNAPPTTMGLLPIVIQQPPRPALVQLYPAFQDSQDSAEELSYAVIANTNPGLVGFVGIDAATGMLTVDPASGAQGQMQLTVQATDKSGASVTTGLNLHVGPLVDYATFATAYFGSGGPGISGLSDDPVRNGIGNLLKYAFFLHPLKNGDRAGLPKLDRIGSARVFSHLRPKFATDLIYTYEKSTDLQTWVPAVPGVDYFSATMDEGDGSQRVECLLLNSPARTFMRAKVQLTSNPPPPSAPGASVTGENAAPAAGSEGAAFLQSSAPPPPPNAPLPISSNAVFPSESAVLVGSSLNLPSAVAAADMDNDGWADLVSISEGDDRVSWYRNGQGNFASRQVLAGQTRSGSGVVCADFTGDGLPDIAASSATDNKVSWYRNLGGGVISAQVAISTAAQYATAIAAADMDHDGRIDIVSASGYGSASKLAWYRNQGAPNYFIAGQENLIVSPGGSAPAASGNLPFAIAAADIDQDPSGHTDLAVASYNESTVSFLRGNGTNTFTRQILSTAEGGAIDVTLGDMDGDGLKDIISISAYGISALGQSGGRVVWFKNNGAAPFGPANAIALDTPGLNGVAVADMNSDGKLDVLASTVRAPGQTTGSLLWFQNLGSGNFGNPLASAQIISTSGFEGKSVATADFDHNGLIDAAVAWQASNKHSVYLNLGGQVTLTGADTAPPVIYESGRNDVLSVSLTNHGGPGQDHARLATVGLLFEKAAAVAMTTEEANQLIDKLHVYADSNGSGAFEPAADLLVSTKFHLALSSGKASLSLQNARPSSVAVAPGGTGTFFVVPELTANASSQNPNSFRITHVVSGAGATTARAAYSGDLLILSGVPANVTSSFVTAQVNSTPTTIGLPNLTVFDPTSASYVQLPNYFSDAEEGAALLKYTITQNTNPALFTFAGIDSGSNRLSLKYRAGVPGSAALTIRATDSLGKFVSASFQVTVGYTFTNWASLNPPPTGGSGPADLARIYAFGLNPLAPHDPSRAPRIWSQGAVKGLRHLRQRWSNDLTYSYLISEDMVNWTPAILGVHFYEFRDHLPDGLDQSDVVLLVEWPRAFIRAQAQLQ